MKVPFVGNSRSGLVIASEVSRAIVFFACELREHTGHVHRARLQVSGCLCSVAWLSCSMELELCAELGFGFAVSESPTRMGSVKRKEPQQT